MPKMFYISSILPTINTGTKYITTGKPYYMYVGTMPTINTTDFDPTDIMRTYMGLPSEKKHVFLVHNTSNVTKGKFYIGVSGSNWDFKTTDDISDTNILNYTGKWKSRTGNSKYTIVFKQVGTTFF